MSDFVGQHQDEEVEFVFRRHLLDAKRGFIFFAICIALSFIPLNLIPDRSLGFWVWLGICLIGLIGLLYAWPLWYFSVYIVTNQRIRQVSQRGFFKRTVVDLGLDKIQSISYEVPGIFGGIFGYGTLLIQTQVGDMTIEMVKSPEKIYNRLQDVIGKEQDA